MELVMQQPQFAMNFYLNFYFPISAWNSSKIGAYTVAQRRSAVVVAILLR